MVFSVPTANLPLTLSFLFRITSRSSFPQWGDSWGRPARDSPTARAVPEARQGEVALPASLALTSNTIVRALGLALALDLGVQVVLGAMQAEEVLLAQQGLVRQEQASILTRVKCLLPKAEKSPGMRPGLGVGCRRGLLRYLDGSSGSRRKQRHVYSTQKSYPSVTFLSFITYLTPGYHVFANRKQLLACFTFGPQPLVTPLVQSSRLISISS